jgi:hypothetical protein
LEQLIGHSHLAFVGQASQNAEKVTIIEPQRLAPEFLVLRDCQDAIFGRLNASI